MSAGQFLKASVYWSVSAGQCLQAIVYWPVSAGQRLQASVSRPVYAGQCLPVRVCRPVSVGQCLQASVCRQCLQTSVHSPVSPKASLPQVLGYQLYIEGLHKTACNSWVFYDGEDLCSVLYYVTL
jgi:hypothetical protein